MKAIFALLCLVALTSRTQAQTDEQMSQLMVGSWRSLAQYPVVGGVAHFVYDFTYYANGQFDGTVGVTMPGNAMPFSVTGAWQIENGILTTQVERVNPPSAAYLLPGGSTLIHFIDRISWRVEGSSSIARRQ